MAAEQSGLPAAHEQVQALHEMGGAKDRIRDAGRYDRRLRRAFDPHRQQARVASFDPRPGEVGQALHALFGSDPGDGAGPVNLDTLQDQNAARRLGAASTGSEYALESPTAWLFGNEAQGLSAEELALADHRVAVPVYGAAESLNLGTAATVCLYASARSQQDGGTPQG